MFRMTMALTLLLAPAVAPEPEPGAAEVSAETVLGQLQRWLDGTRDLQGRFEQQLLSGALGADVEESGRLYVQRPGRMRWNYTHPEEKVALVDGLRTWLYVAEDRQLILAGLDSENELMAVLLTGRGRLADLFDPSLEASPNDGGDGAYRLRLVPGAASAAVEEVILLTLRPPRYAIEAVEVLDAAGNRMRYRFRRLRRNQGLAEELFRFDPPPGTDIVGSHDPPPQVP